MGSTYTGLWASRNRRRSAMVIVVLLSIVLSGLVFFSRWLVVQYLTLPTEERQPIVKRPEDHGLINEEVSVTTEDGLVLHGWYLPGKNGATVMVLHGTPGGRQDGLYEAVFLNRHGYNVLNASFRAHDDSDGELVSFGYHELKDVAAWHNYLLGRAEVDPSKIGIFGESMGGVTGILYTAQNETIKALVSASAFTAASEETIANMLEFEYDPPDWITPVLAGVFVFWAENVEGFESEAINPEAAIAHISPRPVLIIHGGNENRIALEDGRRLYAAAGETKEFWFVPEAGHVNFEQFRPEEYAQRVTAFFDRHLLDQ